jgi:hypothetical protein
MMVNIKGLDRAAVLAALYNAARPQGLGFLHYDPTPMTVEEARQIWDQYAGKEGLFVDYLKGRVMKVLIPRDENELEAELYDRDNSEGTAALVIWSLRATGDVNNEVIQKIHRRGVAEALQLLKNYLENPPQEYVEEKGNMVVFHLGIPPDLVEPLKEVIKEIEGGK